jgi:hypothetical protein
MLASDSRQFLADQFSSGVQRLHAGRALGNVKVEGAFTELVGEDQLGDLSSLLSVF